jgi:DeoR family glycerol-3-phosphate regulon repressor
MRRARTLGPKLRQEKIAEVVRQQGKVSVDNLCARFNTSHETIRRDLTALAEAGTVQKIHGGAKLPGGEAEGPFRERMRRNAVGKRIIARKVANLVTPGETIFIDTGSTTLMCAEEIAKVNGLTVITNSSYIAKILADEGNAAAVFLLGGRYDADNRETLGPMAIGQVQMFHADRALLTIGALDAEAGATSFNFDEAQIARAMLDNANNIIVLSDASKFGRTAACKVCPLERIDALVTDRKPSGPLEAALAQAEVTVH